jgi:type IV secretory pathway VirB4 component
VSLLARRRGRIPVPAGLPAPDAVDVGRRVIRVGEVWCRTLIVVGYPREVGNGWLEPLLTHPGAADISVHVEPVPQAVAAATLRRQLARLESTRRLDAEHGRLVDAEVEAAADDAEDLARRHARGEGRLFRVGLYVTVRGRDREELEHRTASMQALLDSLLLDAHPATWRTLQGWVTTLPLGLDNLGVRRSLDTAALAASFPFAAAELTSPAATSAAGVLYGRNLRSHGLVCWDRFACDNYNAVILAKSGAGKSYLVKLEALRSLYRGVDVAVVDPDGEYQRLADAVGGAYLALGASGVRLNPLDLHQPGDDADGEPAADALTRRALFVHALVEVMARQPLAPEQRAALDRAIVACYQHAGITADPRTHRRPAPLLRDLAAELQHDAERDPAAGALAAQLAPYVSGSWRGLFDGPTTTRPAGHLVVFGIGDLPEAMAGVGTMLALDAVWQRLAAARRRRRQLVVVDEAWLLLRDPAGARFLWRLAKTARKHWCGLTVVTQDVGDVLASELGQAVVANAATQVLLGQAPQALGALARAFRLSEGEQAFLAGARAGEGILVAGGSERVAFQGLASPAEHLLVTSDPAELADLDDADPGGAAR